MLTRELLDEVLPDSVATFELASKLCNYSPARAPAQLVPVGLRWIVMAADEARSVYPLWASQNPLIPVYRLEFVSLAFKPKDENWPLEGWRLGTECWCVRLRYGSTYTVSAETLPLAVARGIVVTYLLKKRHETAPDKRKRLFEEIDKLTPKKETP